MGVQAMGVQTMGVQAMGGTIMTGNRPDRGGAAFIRTLPEAAALPAAGEMGMP